MSINFITCSACSKPETACGGCHHCGRPLCRKHAYEYDDPAFIEVEEPDQDALIGTIRDVVRRGVEMDALQPIRSGLEALHDMLQWTADRLATTHELPAIHCKSCLESNHGTSALKSASRPGVF